MYAAVAASLFTQALLGDWARFNIIFHEVTPPKLQPIPHLLRMFENTFLTSVVGTVVLLC